MPDRCEDCDEIKRLGFQIDGVDIMLQKQRIVMEGIQQEQNNRDVEHEAMIQNLTNGMGTMSGDFRSLKNEFGELKIGVRNDIQAIEDRIPALFELAMTKMLAKIGKWFLFTTGVFIAILALAWTRPHITAFLKELYERSQNTEISYDQP